MKRIIETAPFPDITKRYGRGYQSITESMRAYKIPSLPSVKDITREFRDNLAKHHVTFQSPEKAIQHGWDIGDTESRTSIGYTLGTGGDSDDEDGGGAIEGEGLTADERADLEVRNFKKTGHDFHIRFYNGINPLVMHGKFDSGADGSHDFTEVEEKDKPKKYKGLPVYNTGRSFELKKRAHPGSKIDASPTQKAKWEKIKSALVEVGKKSSSAASWKPLHGPHLLTKNADGTVSVFPPPEAEGASTPSRVKVTIESVLEPGEEHLKSAVQAMYSKLYQSRGPGTDTTDKKIERMKVARVMALEARSPKK